MDTLNGMKKKSCTAEDMYELIIKHLKNELAIGEKRALQYKLAEKPIVEKNNPETMKYYLALIIDHANKRLKEMLKYFEDNKVKIIGGMKEY